MSKRTQSETPTEDGTIKRPRLDIQEQIKRAGILAEQLRNTVGNDDVDSKTTAANQIASEELVRIFESLQEKTAGTSESVNGLIKAHIEVEVKIMMDFLVTMTSSRYSNLSYQVTVHLKPQDVTQRAAICRKVEEKMEGVDSGDYVNKIKETIKETLVVEMQNGVGNDVQVMMKHL
ncbi:hypothetical protein D6C89_04156 [Aureobasidium pullulans]|nr:hypothetical protein D6C89_04156 [Aureobasidium pullulans]